MQAPKAEVEAWRLATWHSAEPHAEPVVSADQPEGARILLSINLCFGCSSYSTQLQVL